MVRVAIWGSLRAATGGRAEVEVEAGNLRADPPGQLETVGRVFYR